MTKVEQLERDIRTLSTGELSEFRRWVAHFDAAVWDVQIEQDVESGALDAMAGAAIAEYRAGGSRTL